jgi:hypothetical protein
MSWSTFDDFANALKGHDNVNVAHDGKTYLDAYAFMHALCARAGISTSILSPHGRCQPFCALRSDGTIYIKVLGNTTTSGNVTTGTYRTWTISPGFSVSQGTEPYRVEKPNLH